MSASKEELIQREEKLIQHGLEQLISTAAGRAWAFHFLSQCGIYQVNSIEPQQLTFEAGKRNLGIKFLYEMESLDPDVYGKMRQEHNNRKKEIDNVRSTNTSDTSDSDTSFNHL
jgi:hypothetical protein